jgi:LytS/YehU family sensor histidine kinase
MREFRIREKANLDNQIAVAEMKALHAQMNPHFIFNSLNSIKEMVLSNEVQEASRYLSDFAHLIRMTLDQSRQTFVSLRSTMKYLSSYVEMEQIRKSNFNFQMEAESALDPDETLIPPMLIQPFIENAIWHGMEHNKKSINIRVTFRRLDGHLVCTIEDDGIGIEKAREKHNGMKSKHQSVSINNIQTRIDLLNQKHHFNSRIEILDKHVRGDGAVTGTLVKITLPLDIQEEQ